jgi:hypothetical protein
MFEETDTVLMTSHTYTNIQLKLICMNARNYMKELSHANDHIIIHNNYDTNVNKTGKLLAVL